jgi:hypothetical protein
MLGWGTRHFDGGFLIYTIMLNLEKELENQIKKNNQLKKLFELTKENEQMENHYSQLWFEKQQTRIRELLEDRKQKEKDLL